jgi:hypothetical protein
VHALLPKMTRFTADFFDPTAAFSCLNTNDRKLMLLTPDDGIGSTTAICPIAY